MYGMNTVADGYRQCQRHNNHQCREDIQDHAKQQQKNIEQHEKGQLAVDMFTDKVEQPGRYFGIDQIIG